MDARQSTPTLTEASRLPRRKPRLPLRSAASRPSNDKTIHTIATTNRGREVSSARVYSPLPPSSPPLESPDRPPSPVQPPSARKDNSVAAPVQAVVTHAEEDPFGFFAVEKALKVSRPERSRPRTRLPTRYSASPAHAVGPSRLSIFADPGPPSAPEPDVEGYDSNEDLYDNGPLPTRATPIGERPPGGTPAPGTPRPHAENLELTPKRRTTKRQRPEPGTPSSVLASQVSSPMSTPSRARASNTALPEHATPLRPHPRKRVRTKGKENLDALASGDDASPPRAPLAVKGPVRRSTRAATTAAVKASGKAVAKPSSSRVRQQRPPRAAKSSAKPRSKARDASEKLPSSDEDEDETMSDAFDAGGKVRNRTRAAPKRAGEAAGAAYAVEREKRKAYFRDLDDYELVTEDVYVV
jgi:hypothetical protein